MGERCFPSRPRQVAEDKSNSHLSHVVTDKAARLPPIAIHALQRVPYHRFRVELPLGTCWFGAASSSEYRGGDVPSQQRGWRRLCTSTITDLMLHTSLHEWVANIILALPYAACKAAFPKAHDNATASQETRPNCRDSSPGAIDFCVQISLQFKCRCPPLQLCWHLTKVARCARAVQTVATGTLRTTVRKA